jgi:hypothetical protein
MSDIPELTDEQLKSAIPARIRRRLIEGRFESGEDIAALRNLIGLTQDVSPKILFRLADGTTQTFAQ